MTKILRMTPMSAPKGNTGTKGFFDWLKKTQPRIWKSTMARIGTVGLGDVDLTTPAATTSTAPVSDSLADKIKDLVFGVSQAYLSAQQLKAQKEVLDMQIARVKAGLPPANIDMSKYGLAGPSVSLGISPETQSILMWGAIGLAAVYLVPKLLKR